jgi:hypothetical protein
LAPHFGLAQNARPPEAAPPAPVVAPPAPVVAPPASSMLLLQAGTIALEPFTISPSTAKPGYFQLKPATSTDVRGFVEVGWLERYAWDQQLDLSKDAQAEWDWAGKPGDHSFKAQSFDCELRGGFAFANSESQSSSSIGGGDGFGDGSLGWSIVRGHTDYKANQPPDMLNLNLESFASFVADSSYSLVHPAYGIGLALADAIPVSTTSQVEIFGRIGIAGVDSPKLIGTASDGETLVANDGNGNPKFDTMGAVQMRFEARVPISITGGSSGYLSFGGTYYELLSHGRRDPWSMYVAMTISPQTLFNGLKSMLGSFGSPSTPTTSTTPPKPAGT